jgi:hypothetical protein
LNVHTTTGFRTTRYVYITVPYNWHIFIMKVPL